MAHSKSLPSAALPSPLLMQIARAIAHDAERGTILVPGNLVAALTELATLAGLSVPARGVVASDELRNAIDRVAIRHLKRAHIEKQFQAAVDRVRNPHKRDAIEVAHAQVLDLGELSHYYAGVASGVTLVDLKWR